MAGTVTLTLDLLARDRVSAVLAKVGGETEGLAGKLRTMGRTISSTGSQLTTGLTLPLVLIGGLSAKAASDFSSAMTRIHTQAGGTAKDVRVLSREVLDLSKSAQQGPTDLANALYHLKSVGLDNADAMKALAASSKLAAVGGSDLEATTNAVAGAWRSGIKGAQNFSREIGTLNAIVGAGNMSMADLTDAMGTGFLASAKTFGVSLKQAGAALALMTDEGVPANAAATRLRMSFSLLAAPSDAAAKVLGGIGVSAHRLGEDMQGPGGILTALDYLHAKLKRSGQDSAEQAQTLSRAFGGGRSSSAILALLNNLDVVHKKFDQIKGSAANFGESVSAQAKTAAAQFAQFKASAETAGVKLGTLLLPVLVKIANALGDFADWVGQLSPGMQKLILVVGAVAAALGPVLVIVGSLITLIGAIATPVGLAVIAIGALVIGLIALYKHSETFRTIVNGVFTEVLSVIRNFVGMAEAFWHRFGGVITHVATFYFGELATIIKGALHIVSDIFKFWKDVFNGDWSKAWHDLTDILDTAIGTWYTVMDKAWHFILTAAENGAKKLLTWLGGLPHKLISAVGKLGSLLFSSGVALIQGFINGIQSMSDRVKGTVSGIANLAKDTVNNLLGIHSPSKVFHEIGINVVQGLIQGIDSQISALKSKMQQVATSVSGAFTSSAFAATDASGNPIGTGAGLISAQSGILQQTKRFTHDLRTLIDDGIAKPLIGEILSTGNFAAAHALATGPAREIRRLNHLYGATQHQENRISSMVDEYMGYPGRVADLQRQREIDRELLKVLKELAKTKGGITFENTFKSDDKHVRRLVRQVVEQQTRAARRAR